MHKPLFSWMRVILLAIAPSLSLATTTRAQETPLDYLASFLDGPPQHGEQPAGSAGCQGNCGWISDGGCEEECCYPQTTARLEYLMWWGRGQNIPALVTTSPNGTPQNEAGVLGFPNTTTLFGNQGIQ
ncbi:MAG: BBP7 family outer membrane beta-barrel protein, partial [Planctomycetales bacterium]|nr:BBP7 family outer membrane beta-barrel protein [Planctomycetales bacterium]